MNFGWAAQALSQFMVATQVAGQRMVLRAREVCGGNTTLVFEIVGYAEIAGQQLPAHCR